MGFCTFRVQRSARGRGGALPLFRGLCWRKRFRNQEFRLGLSN